MNISTIEEQLRRHVHTLAGDIGERNVFRPSALQAAADYIGTEWRHQGYEVITQSYEAKGVECMNLEVGIHLSWDTFCRLNAKCRRGRRRSQSRIGPP